MKKTVLVIAAVAAFMIGSSDLFAQGKWGADSAECVKYMSYYKEYYKQKAYDEATPNWRKAYEICPATASQNMLIDGTTLVRRLINANNSNPEYRAALIDTLLTLHDTRAEYYPNYAVAAYNNKGIDLSNYVKTDYARLYNEYEKIIANNGDRTRPTILLFDLHAAIDYYQQGGVGAEAVINAYQRNMALIDELPTRNDAEAEQNEQIKNDMGNLFAASKVASCENLVEIFTPRYEANPDDVAVLSSIIQTMVLTEGCTSSDLFLNAVTKMNELEPSASASYFLFKLHSDRGNINEAIDYMDAAIASNESDSISDASWGYELAVYCFKNGRTAKAMEVAGKVAEASEEYKGRAYFLMGTIWATTTCGGDEIAKRAPYWVAVDYMNKAKAADPSLTNEVNMNIASYTVYYPAAADAFMYDLTNGQSYTVSCNGMRATTTVRTQ